MVGIDRSNPLRAARAVGLALTATGRARKLLREIDADVVIGGGGYVSGPVGLAARSLGKPLILTEADSHLGIANRLLAPLAKRVFLAFPLEGREGERYEVVGRPIPAATLSADRTAARERFGVPQDETCLLVFGGSLGARTVNQAALDAFGEAPPCEVLHACGVRDHADLAARLERLGSPARYHLHPYIDRFADALAAADLAVGRAGGAVFELAAAGVPSILVPYPHATADHQTSNARHLESAGAAVVVPDGEVDGPRLAREVGSLLADPSRRSAMANAARSFARPDAAERIAREVVEIAGGSGR